jgi:cyclopropane-fatty-acyl-phospholipid synthase
LHENLFRAQKPGAGERLRRVRDVVVRHSRRRSASNVRSHYDLGNDFFARWLDSQLVYTCAYFETPEQTLEEAQVAKHEHVCRKLGLREGERVIDAGCGWGALALHMARRHGVRVRAFNVSARQVQYARDRAAREHLADRVEFVEADYRDIHEPADVFVSVGMLEHVGRENYQVLGAVMDRCLSPKGGRGLLHFIGRDRSAPLNAWIRKRIFPGAYAPTLAEAAAGTLEPWSFSITDVENLRLHYVTTLEHWRTRYEHALDAIAADHSPDFVRAWRLYLAGSEAAFRAGSLQLFQVLFHRTGSPSVPWTRSGWYASAPAN